MHIHVRVTGDISGKKMFSLTRTTQCCVHMILQAGLCLCQVFSGSEQYEKVRHSDRISQNDLFTPRLSLLDCPPLTLVNSPPPPPPHTHSLLAPLALGGTQEPLGPAGRVTSAGARAHMFLQFPPSSVKLCKYFSPVSLSLEHQLRVSVWFS